MELCVKQAHCVALRGSIIKETEVSCGFMHLIPGYIQFKTKVPQDNANFPKLCYISHLSLYYTE